ncbi:hypothetical protein HPY42_05550 [Coprothermobacteraceae bacterium]|nr:hypothetical protein [Coprothermobacteraceae bacterium]
MMERIKALIFSAVLEYVERSGKVRLPFWWKLLPRAWKKEFSELIAMILPVCQVKPVDQVATRTARARLTAGLVIASLLLLLGGGYGLLVEQNRHTSEQVRSLTATSEGDKAFVSSQLIEFYSVKVPVDMSGEVDVAMQALKARRIEGTQLWVVNEPDLLQSLAARGWEYELSATARTPDLENSLADSQFHNPVLVLIQTH